MEDVVGGFEVGHPFEHKRMKVEWPLREMRVA